MDIMDKVYAGKYENPVSFHSDLGWVKKMPNGSYVKSSKHEYDSISSFLKSQVQSDLIQEMDFENKDKAVELFNCSWRHLAENGIACVISAFRELVQVVGP